MQEAVDSVRSWVAEVPWLSPEAITGGVRAALLFVGGVFAARVVSRIFARIFQERLAPQQTVLLRQLWFWAVLALFTLMALDNLGFEVGFLAGAAGVLTVAIGFASQTSASNLISGLFLISERPFELGDAVRIGATSGEVLSIDLLSVKLRTFDNLFVRIPNENIIKSEVINLSRFPIRRIDLVIGVAYGSDLAVVRELLLDLVENHPTCLDDPRPVFMVTGFGDSAVTLQFSVWATRENFLEAKTSLQHKIHDSFAENGIEIPFPHRTLTGTVQIVDRDTELQNEQNEVSASASPEPMVIDDAAASLDAARTATPSDPE